MKFLAQLNSLNFDDDMSAETTDNKSGVNCKYYDTQQFSVLNVSLNSFSLFHMNISFLSLHFHELKILLNQLGQDFNIIGITEIKFQTNIPPTNCDLPGYVYKQTPTESDKGGALLYIPTNLQFF